MLFLKDFDPIPATHLLIATGENHKTTNLNGSVNSYSPAIDGFLILPKNPSRFPNSVIFSIFGGFHQIPLHIFYYFSKLIKVILCKLPSPPDLHTYLHPYHPFFSPSCLGNDLPLLYKVYSDSYILDAPSLTLLSLPNVIFLSCIFNIFLFIGWVKFLSS